MGTYRRYEEWSIPKASYDPLIFWGFPESDSRGGAAKASFFGAGGPPPWNSKARFGSPFPCCFWAPESCCYGWPPWRPSSPKRWPRWRPGGLGAGRWAPGSRGRPWPLRWSPRWSGAESRPVEDRPRPHCCSLHYCWYPVAP